MPRAASAARIASISAWAVGSLSRRMRFCAAARIRVAVDDDGADRGFAGGGGFFGEAEGEVHG